jgi:hypothetical protein
METAALWDLVLKKVEMFEKIDKEVRMESVVRPDGDC